MRTRDRRRFYRDPLKEIEYCLRVGGTRHGELLKFLVKHPGPWRKKEMMLHGEVNMSQATLEGALSTLESLGVVKKPDRGVYQVDLEMIRKVVRPHDAQEGKDVESKEGLK